MQDRDFCATLFAKKGKNYINFTSDSRIVLADALSLRGHPLATVPHRSLFSKTFICSALIIIKQSQWKSIEKSSLRTKFRHRLLLFVNGSPSLSAGVPRGLLTQCASSEAIHWKFNANGLLPMCAWKTFVCRRCLAIGESQNNIKMGTKTELSKGNKPSWFK